MSFVEFRIFDGVSGELRPWISWLEEFFVQEKFTAAERMNLAQSLLEGEAEAWFYRIQKTLIFYSWKELKDRLLLRFGDFADPDRIRLIAERDRFLLEIREEARIMRMKTTSIPATDSIRETKTEAVVPTDTIPIMNWMESRDSILAPTSLQEENYDPVTVAGASCEKDESHEDTTREEVSITQNQVLVSPLDGGLLKFRAASEESSETRASYQVPVSPLEPGLSFSSESLYVSEAWSSDIVSNNRVQLQSGFECVKNKTNAHQVLDKTSPHKDMLKSKSKRKLSLSPKTWMFKLRNKNLQRQYSCSRATFGSKGKEHNSRYWRRMRLTHMSRLLCNLRVSHDHWGWGQFVLADLVSHMRHKWKSTHLRAVFDLQSSPSYALDVVNKTSKPWEKQMTFTSAHVASVHSLSFEVGTEKPMSSGLSHNRQVWEPGGVIAAHVLVDWLVDFNGYDGIVDGIRCLAIDSRRASRVWERGGLDISAGLTDWLMKCYKGFEISRLMRQLHEIDFQWVRRQDLADLCVGQGLLVFPWNLMLLEFFLFIHLEDKVCLSGASNSWCGWLVFDRGKNSKGDVHVDSLISSMLPLYVYQMGVSDIQDHDKELVADPVTQAVLNRVTNTARFGFASVMSQSHAVHLDVKQDFLRNQELTLTQSHKFKVDKFGRLNNTRLTVWRVLCLLGTRFWSTSFKKLKFSKDWWYKFKDSLWQRECGRELLEEELLVPEAILAVRFDDVSSREFWVQWQQSDSSANSWVPSKDLVCFFLAFKLEDKLVLRGESIDTIQGLAGDVAEISSSSEESDENRGFAVSSHCSSRSSLNREAELIVLFMRFVDDETSLAMC